ncbi:MAG: DNA translocase FtsK 4TM domain-containing protein [Bacteroidales bacterium]|nr:DNA translocase FtsK 4TM domain-containing protein [Bacteroidales bacterium]
MLKLHKSFPAWSGMDPERRTRILKISGLVVGAFALFTLISILSYLFTWTADQSLLGDPEKLDLDVAVHNAAGKLGHQWGWLLVTRWFGLGAFLLVAALCILSVRLLFGRRSFSVIKAILLSLTAAVISSFILAWFSQTVGLENAFGGGLGGDCGSLVVNWSKNLFGPIITLILLVLLTVCWCFFASRRFSDWFASLGGETQPVRQPEPERPQAPVEEKKKRFKWVRPTEDDTPLEEDETPVENPMAPVAPAAPVAPVAPVSAPTAPEPPEDDLLSRLTSGRGVAAPVAPVETPPAESPAKPPVTDGSEGLEVIEGEELSTDNNVELPRIDVRNELDKYRFPPLELLDDYEDSRQEVSQDELRRNNFKIRAALKTYRIDVDNVKAVVGPTVTLYKVYPAPGVKIAAIRSLQDDIAMALKADKGVRVVTLADSVGIEVANDHPSIVPLKAMFNDPNFLESKAELPVAIGYTITQKVKVFDLADAPHLLVAGATKQGKSVGLNVLIASLLYSKHPAELKFVFIDPKMVEFSAYAKLLKHYLAVLPNAASEEEEKNTAIVKDAKSAEVILKSLCAEMDDRYQLLSKAYVNNVKLYNEKYKDRHLLPTEGHRFLPYLVVVVDEYADLTMSVGGSSDSKAVARSISTSIIRLAQKGRAAGIHVVLATQRPSVDVITGLIKANFPTRIAFRVFSQTDSRTILDSGGAEKLIGKGDMIYYAGADVERVQCAFISNDEINALNDFIGQQIGYKKSYNTPYYLPAPEPEAGEEGGGMVDMKNLDERFEEAARMVVTSQRGSTSDLQRRLGMGYAKAGRVMDQLEAAGIVGPQQGSKPREVLVTTFEELDRIIEAFKNQ